MVSGRTVAALADWDLLAHRRATAVDRRGTVGRPVGVEPASSAAKDEAAQELLAGVADSLGLPPSQVRPAYEDPLARLAAKVRKPQGDPVDPGDDIAEDTGASRDSLMAHLDESNTAPRAFVLPLHRRDDDAGWASADWRLRRGRVVLVEGDSPAGLRLPLASISWRPPRDHSWSTREP